MKYVVGVALTLMLVVIMRWHSLVCILGVLIPEVARGVSMKSGCAMNQF